MRALLRHRWFRRIALALLLPLPTWILLCNLLLWSGAIEAIVTRDGEITTVRLTHGRAWMLWPTVVHVRDASLEIDTYSYQLAVEIDDGVVDMRLFSLFRRRVQFEHIEGSGVRVQYRDKIDPEDATAPQLAAWAPFDGTPPAVQSTTPKPLPAPEDAWGVDLDVIDADVERVWIDAFDVEPCGHVHGAMHWVDGGDLSVPDTSVRLADAGLWVGPHEALRGLAGEVSLTFAPFDTSEVTGDQVPGYLSFTVSTAGELVDPTAVAVWWPELDGKLGASPGPIEIEAQAQDGVLQQGTRIHHRSEHAAIGPERAYLTGAPELVLDLDDDGRPRARVWLRDATLQGRPGGELARSGELRGDVLVTHADMARPWALERAHVETDDVHADDLRRVSAAIGSDDLELRRGRAHGRGEAELGADGIPHAHYELDVDDGVLVAGSVEFRANLSSRGNVQRNADGELVASDLELKSGGVTVKSRGGTSEGTWVRLRDGTVRYKDDSVTVETRGTVEDARPVIVHLTKLDPFLRVVPDLQQLAPIRVHGKLVVKGGTIEVEVVDAEHLGLHVAALWRRRHQHWRLALFASGITAIGFTTKDGEQLPRLQVLVGKPWFSEQRRWVRGLAHRGDRPALH